VDTASTDVKKGLQPWLTAAWSFTKEGSLKRSNVPGSPSWVKGRKMADRIAEVMPYLMGLTSQFTTYSLYDCGKINSVRVIPF
jgi:hypothetical protein